MTKRRARGDGTMVQVGRGTWRLRVATGTDRATGRTVQVSRTVHVANKTEALRELRRFVEEVDTGRLAKRGLRVGNKATVGVLLERYVEHLERVGRSETTLETYRYVIASHLLPAFGAVECRKVDAFALDEYYAQKQAEGLANSTIGTHHAILSGAFAQAAKWGWIRANPAPDATPPKAAKKKKFIPEVGQVRTLIEATSGDMVLSVAVVLAAIVGARRGELCGLMWPDVDWGRQELVLARQRVPVLGGDVTKTLKNADGEDDVRRVSIGALGLAVLDAYRQATAERAEVLGVIPLWNGWLLSEDCGHSPIPAKTLGEAINRLGKRTGIPVTAHAFRRFAATQAVAQGADIVTIAGRMGHTPDMLLKRYAGLVARRDVEVARGIEALVLNPGRETSPSPEKDEGDA